MGSHSILTISLRRMGKSTDTAYGIISSNVIGMPPAESERIERRIIIEVVTCGTGSEHKIYSCFPQGPLSEDG